MFYFQEKLEVLFFINDVLKKLSFRRQKFLLLFFLPDKMKIICVAPDQSVSIQLEVR